MSDLDNLLVKQKLAAYREDGSIEELQVPEKVQEIFRMAPDGLHQANREQIEEHLQALSSYLLYFTVQYNKANVEAKRALNVYKKKLREVTFQMTGSTLKEKETKAQQDPEVERLEMDEQEKSAVIMYMDGIVDAVREKLNVVKKIYDARVNEAKYNRD